MRIKGMGSRKGQEDVSRKCAGAAGEILGKKNALVFIFISKIRVVYELSPMELLKISEAPTPSLKHRHL